MVRNGATVLQVVAAERYGFLSPTELAEVAEDGKTRLTPLLVRFHEGRLTAPAQYVKSIIDALTGAGWCVRDVSIPARG